MSWTTPFASALARRDRTAFAVGHPRHANEFPPPTAKYFDIAAITDTSPPSVPSLGRAVAGLEPAEPQPQLLRPRYEPSLPMQLRPPPAGREPQARA